MPSCFQLTKKGETEPSKLCKVDEEICAFLGEPVHEKYWSHSWPNAIGFTIAALGVHLGTEKLRQIIAEYEDPKLLEILKFLEDNYSSRAWYEVKS